MFIDIAIALIKSLPSPEGFFITKADAECASTVCVREA
jgi:hypothetical protein